MLNNTQNKYQYEYTIKEVQNMKTPQWYEALFENYAEKYDNENFNQSTKGEYYFIETELKSDKSLKILDEGCGTGRQKNN